MKVPETVTITSVEVNGQMVHARVYMKTRRQSEANVRNAIVNGSLWGFVKPGDTVILRSKEYAVADIPKDGEARVFNAVQKSEWYPHSVKLVEENGDS